MHTPTTIPQALRLHATQHPGHPALLAAGRPALTFAELWQAVTLLAGDLRGWGVAPGDLVALALPNGPEAAVASLATMAAAGFAPLNAQAPAAELTQDLARLRPRVLLTLRGHQPPGLADMAGIELPVLTLEPDLDYGAGWCRLAGSAPAALPDPCWAAPDAVAVAMRTSGTTGEPTWRRFTQAQLLRRARTFGQAFQLVPDDRCLHLLPLFYAHGLDFLLFSPLVAGGAVACGEVYRGEGFFERLAQSDATWCSVPPAVYEAILGEAATRGLNHMPNRLRFLRCAGGPPTPGLAERLRALFGAPMVESYGMTEAGLIAANPLPPARSVPGSVGLPVLPVEVRDADGRPAAVGEHGEIVLLPPPEGWFADADPEAGAVDDFPTGDLGYLDDDGYLYINGRAKDVVKRAGESVLLREVDAALEAHPAVRQAVAFSVPHPHLGEAVGAAVTLLAGAAITEAELRAWLGGRLAAFKVPARIAVVASLPLSANFKPSRPLTAALVAGLPTASAPAPPAPLSPLEQQVLDIWREVLARPDLGPDTDFFEAGGNSLAAAAVVDRVERRLGVAGLLLDAPYLAPTVRLFVGQWAQRRVPDPRLVPLRTTGSRRPLFCVLHPDDLSRVAYFPLTRLLPTAVPVWGVQPPPEDAAGRPLGTLEDFASECIAAIRTVQPSGPYQLAGHSWAGLLAFEMAQQLQAAGEPVSLLCLLDALPYRTPGDLPQLPARALSVARTLRGQAWPERWRHLRTLWRRGRSGDLTTPAVWRSKWRYRPSRYPGRVTLVQAHHRPAGEPLPPSEGWAALAAALDVVTAPGDHATLLSAPDSLAVVSAALAQRLA